MAARRKGLSQRRKAVGFTQESLAEKLGVERSTVIRWEAGDSEPLPSIRPTLAGALQVSIEQLAELLTNTEAAAPTRTLAADSEVTTQAPLPEIPPQVRPDGAEVDTLVRPQIAETVEALRRALRSAGVSAEDLAAMLLVGGSSPGPDVSDPPSPETPNLPASRSKKRKRLMAAGSFALALPAVLLSAPFGTPHNVATPSGSQHHAGPVIAIPSPKPGATHGNPPSADPTGAVPAEPTTTPVGDPAPPVVNTAPASHATRVSGENRTAIPSAARNHPPLSANQAWRIATAEADHRWDGVNQVEWAGYP